MVSVLAAKCVCSILGPASVFVAFSVLSDADGAFLPHDTLGHKISLFLEIYILLFSVQEK